MKEEKTNISNVNNYCENYHIINEHHKNKNQNVYNTMQKCLFYETFCLENKNLFDYQKWLLKE